MSGAIPQSEKDYRIKDAADVLIRAEEIKADAKLMADVRKELKKRKEALAKVSVK